jgi:hypothetical protein
LGERGGTPSTGIGWNDLDRPLKWEEGAANDPVFAPGEVAGVGENQNSFGGAETVAPELVPESQLTRQD